MRRDIAAFAALLLASLSGCDWLSKKVMIGKAVSLCEVELMKDLSAPSTYHQVSSEFGKLGAFTKDDFRASIKRQIEEKNKEFESLNEIGRIYLAYQNKLLRSPKEFDEIFDAAVERSPTKLYVVIIYDAENGFGANLRAAYKCDLTADAKGNAVSVFDSGSVNRAVAESK